MLMALLRLSAVTVPADCELLIAAPSVLIELLNAAATTDNSLLVTLTPPAPALIMLLTTLDRALCALKTVDSSLLVTLPPPPPPAETTLLSALCADVNAETRLLTVLTRVSTDVTAADTAEALLDN